MSQYTLKFSCLLIVIFLGLDLNARVVLPALFADHMVLQRDKPIVVWGEAIYETEVTVTFNDLTEICLVENGRWKTTFPAMPAGGPHKLTIKGSNTIFIEDILMGDVFVCGGQSNMEWPLRNINNAEAELKNTNFPNIRMFTVEQEITDRKTLSLEGAGWAIANERTTADFSAIGFLTARLLHQEYEVPIGLIDNAWGGTNIMGWMPEEAFANQQSFEKMIQTFKDTHNGESSFRQAKLDYAEQLELSDVGLFQGWSEPEFDKSDWKKINAPGLWETQGFPDKDGFFWLSKKIELKTVPEDKPCKLGLAKIDDDDLSFVNGILVGSTQGYSETRLYDFFSDHLTEGINEITVRVKDTGGGGGFHGLASDMFLVCESMDTMTLAGNWSIAEGSVNLPTLSKTYDANAFPTNRYNGMVHPLTPYPIAAYLYYQGESDTWQAKTYETLFQNMIRSYRTAWNDNQLPFVFVQLANFMAQDENPVESDWANLRQAQTAALKLPNTAMVSAIDIGEADDIHPRNKQTVALRMAASLKRLVYNESLIFDGPPLEKVFTNSFGTLLTFRTSEKGLTVKGNDKKINGFVIETLEGKLIKIPGILQSKSAILLEYTKPFKSIRYLWANNPGEVQVYNEEGFPVNPFKYVSN
ncbi:MAG TPA: sialate O-acetylesterase [Saprospiraceae bacterium]|nr:sialate O-acetylesterase [Saprospiraceae bacterium]